MDYYEKRNAQVNLAHGLRDAGWELFGYHADQSDPMTDYYAPAYWDGIAVKDNLVLVCTNHSDEGHDIIKETRGTAVCELCGGSGEQPDCEWTLTKARQNPEAFSDYYDELSADGSMLMFRNVVSPLFFKSNGKFKCRRCHGTGKVWDDTKTTREVIGYYPRHSRNGKRVQFHLEKDGIIIKRWYALKPFLNRYNTNKEGMEEAIKNLLDEIERLTTQKTPVKAANTVENGDVEVVRYNEKCIAVFGNTRQYLNDFSRKRGGIGGVFNPRLNHNGNKEPGWIFTNDKIADVESVTGIKLKEGDKS